MTRLDRKIRFKTEKIITVNNSIFGLMDIAMMESFRITEDELDKLCEVATDEELNLFVSETLSFGEKRKLILLLEEKIYGKNN
jgi:hypothetical protein